MGGVVCPGWQPLGLLWDLIIVYRLHRAPLDAHRASPLAASCLASPQFRTASVAHLGVGCGASGMQMMRVNYLPS